MTLAIAALLLSCLAPQGATKRTESWPSGAKRAEYEVARDAEGREQKHGPYRSFHENGELESEGAFEHGEESGPWVYYHPDGTRAAAGSYADALKSGAWETFFPDGKPESKGSYVRGARDGRWTFWRADGTKDLSRSGIYELEVARSKDSGKHTRGYLVDNLRQGTWTSYWPDKSVQLEGTFVDGNREGRWLFTHPDGVPSSLLHTGTYSAGAWRDKLELPEPPPLERARWPALEPSPRGWPERRAELESAIRDALAARAVGHELGSTLSALGTQALPVALEVLRGLDPERAEDRAALGFLEDQVLRRLCAGHALSPHGAAGPPDAPAARELVRAWLSLWMATRADAAFWEEDVPGPTRPGAGLRDVLQDPPIFGRDARAAAGTKPEAAVAAEEPAPGARSEYRLRTGKPKEEALRHAPAGTKEAVSRALRWLAAHQTAEGGWSNADFQKECGKLGASRCKGGGHPAYDVGVSALSVLCFLGDGQTAASGAQRENVARGLAWLASKQTDEGLIGTRELHDFLYGHAIATAALCEAVGLGAEELRPNAERALAFLLSARDPDFAWRYDAPATEPGDTSVTGWALNALVAAGHAGMSVDRAALEGVARWLERVSDPLSGRVGYRERGEAPARTPANDDYPREMSEPMTAVGLWCRMQLGQDPASPIVLAHAKLLATRPPAIDKQYGGDQYYWYYATSALHELGGPQWKAWEDGFRKAVLQEQQKHGDAEGSWDPIGPWGYATGRVGATALSTLALECFYRYPRVAKR